MPTLGKERLMTGSRSTPCSMRFPTGGAGAGSIRSSSVMLGLLSSALCSQRAAVREVMCSRGVMEFDTN